MNKEDWRQKWLDAINELTSLELQKVSWLRVDNINPHWSFVEFMSCYFDDVLLNENYAYYVNIGWISEIEYEIVWKWHDLLDNYSSPHMNDYDHQGILNDKKWIEIVTIGNIAKTKLLQILDGVEKQYLLNDSDINL